MGWFATSQYAISSQALANDATTVRCNIVSPQHKSAVLCSLLWLITHIFWLGSGYTCMYPDVSTLIQYQVSQSTASTFLGAILIQYSLVGSYIHINFGTTNLKITHPSMQWTLFVLPIPFAPVRQTSIQQILPHTIVFCQFLNTQSARFIEVDLYHQWYQL